MPPITDQTLRAQRRHARIQRARSSVGTGIRYGLGQGGRYPNDPHPTRNGLLDCSGFIAWCIGIDRYQGDKGKPWSHRVQWVESTLLVIEGRRLDVLGERLAREIPRPVAGELLAWPDRPYKVLGKKFVRHGHVMLVEEVSGDRCTVWDCTSSKAVSRRQVSFKSVKARGGCALEVAL